MAEGRYKADGFRLESDDFHEYPCLPCAKDNINVAAIKYCVECNENICGKCVSVHNKYAGLKDHHISKDIKTKLGQGGPGLPSQRCDIHAGKLIEVYCRDHDFVGCSACIAIEHRSCEDVKFIPDVATTLQTSKQLQELTSEIQKLERHIENVRKKKAKFVKDLEQNKENILREITLVRQTINDRLDKMEKTMLEEVDAYFKTHNEAVNNAVSEIESLNVNIAEMQSVLNDMKDKNVSAFFVELNKSKIILRSNFNRMLKVLEVTHFNFSTSFYLSRDIENIFQETSSFGFLSDTPILCSTPSRFEHNIRLECDRNMCDIRNMLFTKTNDIVLIDKENKKIKIFDLNFALKDYVITPGQPFDVCEVNESQLAITMHKQKCVQFASRCPLKLQNSFMVGDSCRGIGFHEGKLYVGCGGFSSAGEGPGHIEVYNVKGTLLISYYESLLCPWYIHIHSREEKLFVSDLLGENVISYDLLHYKIEEVQLLAVTRPSGFCIIDATKQLFVCGFGSNNVVTKAVGEPARPFLREKDGLVKPRAIAFDKTRSRLLVSLDRSDFILVYTFPK